MYRVSIKCGIILIVICLFSFSAQAKYAGGTGEPNDPYLIATAEDIQDSGGSFSLCWNLT